MDIASMCYGLETRSPLLDHEVIEYCARLPIGLKVRAGVGKYLLKKLAERYLPRDLIYRPKMGFAIPLSDWLRGRLSTLMEEIVLNENLMWPLSPRVIRQTLDEFREHHVDHSSRLWALLVFGLWRRDAGT
jgi:asparagine synthase (glutamine-hydrolysing)